MKLYTKTGDSGQTALFLGERVDKDHARVEAYGSLDEANSVIGLAVAALEDGTPIAEALLAIQSDLFDIGAELATPEEDAEKLQERLMSAVDEERVSALEAHIDTASASAPPLTTFVLPSGSDASARLQVARAVVRRAERRVVTMQKHAPVRPVVLRYLNRLSDLLFAWARSENARAGIADVPWRAKKDRGS